MKPQIEPGGPFARLFAAICIGFLRAMPRCLREGLARALARGVFALGIRRRVTLENLGHAFPEKTEAERRAIAKGAYENMALAGVESFCSDLVSDAELQRRVLVDDWKGLDQLLASRTPTLIASAHFGSWELFAEVMARRGHAFSAVVRPLRGAFNAWVVNARAKAGVGIILQRGAMRGIFAALKRGEAVVQLIDQVLPAKHGVFVPFFGRPASTTPSISLAALRTGAPVYVVMAAREGDALRMFVEGPVQLPQLDDRDEVLRQHTAQLTAILEGTIRKFPEQWLWLHRRWKVRQDEAELPSVSTTRPAE